MISFAGIPVEFGGTFLYSFDHLYFKTKNNSIIPLSTLYSAVWQSTPFVVFLSEKEPSAAVMGYLY